MPTRTRVKQRPQAQKVATRNAAKISQTQSLELTKTFVHTSVRNNSLASTESYSQCKDRFFGILEVSGQPIDLHLQILTQSRDLFPSEIYEEYEYVADSGVMDYETFTQGPPVQVQVPASTGKHRRKPYTLRVMKRGRCEKVDIFLNNLVCRIC